MTNDEFEASLHFLEISQSKLARILDCDPRLVRRWAAGERRIPPAVALWLRKAVRHRRRYPDPDPPPHTDWKYGASLEVA